jgi:feruloyl esterase
MFPTIAAEVMRQCDPSDGLVDGIITDPKMCHFQPEALLCKGSSSAATTCLTSAQLDTLSQIYHPYVETNNTFIAPGMELGSEAEWPVLLGDPNGGCPLGFGYVQNYLQKGPDWSWKDFDYSIVKLADATDPGAASADNYDLSPFHAKGGKLLHYHGYADAYIPPGMSTYFYERVLHTLVPKGVELDSWYRLFMVPGGGHCSGSANGAPWYFAGMVVVFSIRSWITLLTHSLIGANQAGKIGSSLHSVPGFSDARHDALLALMAWTEEGTAPDQLIATKWRDDTPELGVERQRALCPYPAMPQYIGGDVNEASSFTCGSLPFKVSVVVRPGAPRGAAEAGSVPEKEL